MSEDIVTRLRGWARLMSMDNAMRVGMVEAADEIERLRKMALDCGADKQELQMEIETLRAELLEARTPVVGPGA